MLARTDSESDLGLWDIVLTSTLSSKPWMYSTLSTFALFPPPAADIAGLFRAIDARRRRTCAVGSRGRAGGADAGAF